MTHSPEIQSYLHSMEATLDEPAFLALCETLKDQNRYRELADLHCLRAEHTEEQDAALSQLILAAQIHLQQLDDLPKAQQLLQQVLDKNPHHHHAKQLRRSIQIQHGHLQNARLDLLSNISETTEKKTKSILLFELGSLQEQHLQEPEQAAISYHRAFVVDPSSHTAYQAAHRLYLQQQNISRLLAILRAYIAQNPPRRRHAELLAELGQLCLQHNQETPQQIANYFRQALDLDSTITKAREGLQSLAIHRFKLKPSAPNTSPTQPPNEPTQDTQPPNLPPKLDDKQNKPVTSHPETTPKLPSAFLEEDPKNKDE